MSADKSAALGETVAAARQRMAIAGVHTVTAQFVDIHGSAKGKYIPLAHLGDIERDGVGFAGPSIWGLGLPRNGPRSEFYGRGDLDTLQVLPLLIKSVQHENHFLSGCAYRRD
ncbi:MAG: hypothetical protein ABI144_00600 [Gallionella sp.]